MSQTIPKSPARVKTPTGRDAEAVNKVLPFFMSQTDELVKAVAEKNKKKIKPDKNPHRRSRSSASG